MREQLIDALNSNATSLTMPQIVLNFVVAIIIGFVIFTSYRTSHTRVVYSARFNVSMLMLTTVTTLVMSVIGNNIALSLGMVGALSIVRFRTAIKDPRDTAYIFWAIAVGICCGVAEYRIAITGSLFIFVLLVIFGLVQDNDRYLLVVHAASASEKNVVGAVQEYYSNRAKIRVNNSTKETSELIFEVSQTAINTANKKNTESISEKVKAVEGVSNVNLVIQNDEMR